MGPFAVGISAFMSKPAKAGSSLARRFPSETFIAKTAESSAVAVKPRV